MSRRKLAPAAMLAVMVSIPHVFGIDLSVSGAWESGESWSTGFTPTSTDNATIGTAGGTNLNVTVAPNVAATANGLVVGDAGSGQLEIIGGSLVNRRATLGNRLDSLGVVNVSSGGNWTSTDLLVGGSAEGRIRIDGGIVAAGNSSIGTNAGSTGSVQVENAGSTFAVGSFLNVGNSGRGQLTVMSGGAVETPNTVTLGTNGAGNGTVTVSGAGSSWTVGSFLNVGYRGSGTLSIQNGGQFTTNGTSSLGTFTAGSSGTVTVKGTGSRLVSPTLNVGYAGAGELTIRDGGTVETASALVIGRNATASGSLRIEAGGTLRTSTLNGGAGSAQMTMAGGTLQVIQSSLASSLDVTLQSHAVSTFDTNGFGATFSGVFAGGGGLIKQGGGTLVLAGANTFTGGVTISAGTLQMNSTSALGATGGNLTLAGGRLDLHGQSPGVRLLSGVIGSVITNLVDNSVSTLTVNSAANATFSGSLEDGGAGRKVAIVKRGSGELILDGTSTQTGGTTVESGLLTLSGVGAAMGNATAAGIIHIGIAAGDGASFLVKDGAAAVATDFKLGVAFASIGRAEVNGPGATLRAGTFHLGERGEGQLTVANGATLSTTATNVIGVNAGGVGAATVTGANSTWTTSDYLDVGAAGNGTLKILAGGRVVTVDTGTLGVNAGGTGAVTVAGGGSQWSAPTINVGYYGYGELSVGDGGTVTVNQTLGLGVKSGSFGALNVNPGGTLRVGNLFANAGASQVNFLGGSLVVLGAGFNSLATINFGGTTFSTVDTNGQNATLGGALLGTGGLLKSGGGSLTLGGNNSFGSGIKISAGTIRVTSANALGSASGSLQIEAGELDLNGQGVVIGSLAGTGGVITNQAVNTFATLTVSSGANSTYAGAVADGGSGRTVALVKAGKGELVLTGAASHTGGTTVREGTLSLAGGNATLGSLTAAGNALIGSGVGDNGVFQVGSGARVIVDDLKIGKVALSAGMVNLIDAGSSLRATTMEVGEGGAGHVNVSNGAFLAVTSASSLGVNGGAVGGASVTGPGSRWVSGDFLTVGASGNATLTVSDGGELTTAVTATLGNGANASGAVAVTGAASRWTAGNYLNVGFGGSGNLTLSAGGIVTSNLAGTVATNAGSTGRVMVSGPGSHWSAPNINIGYGGNGTVGVASGGTVAAPQGIVLGALTGSRGTMNLTNGGTLETNGLYGGAGSAQVNFSGGTLRAGTGNFATSLNVSLESGTQTTFDSNGFAMSAAGVFSGAGGLIKNGVGTLTLSGNNTYTGPTAVNTGRLAVHGNQSAATGAVTVASGATLTGGGAMGGVATVSGKLEPGITIGNLTLGGLVLTSSAVLEFEINAATAGSFDQITVTGNTATLGGILSLIFGGTLSRNQAIDLFLGPPSLSGNFDGVTLSGGSYVAGNFFKSGNVWISEQGATTLIFDPSTGILAVVPEPGTLALLGLASGLALYLRAMRRRRVRSNSANDQDVESNRSR